MNITVKVSTSGALSCYRGKERLHRVWEEVPISPGPARAAIRAKVDPVLLRATRLLFGPQFKPADYNEVHQRRILVKQIIADSPRLLIAVYAFVGDGKLSATPQRTVVRRFKSLLQREGCQDFKLAPNGGCYLGLDSKGRKRKDTEANRFWNSYSDFNLPALSEAGWRYLQHLSTTTLQVISKVTWQWTSDYLWAFNVMGQYGLPKVGTPALELLKLALPKCADDDSTQHFARAVAARFSRDDTVPAADIAVLRDWFYEEKRTIRKETRWETLVAMAYAEAGRKAEQTYEKMEVYFWTPPIAPFVADDGITVIPFSNGGELLAEGVTMDNCLRTDDSYAKRAVQGVSQVFSVRGVYGKATVEFVRSSRLQPWSLAQVEGPGGAAVEHAVIHRVIGKIQMLLQGAAQ